MGKLFLRGSYKTVPAGYSGTPLARKLGLVAGEPVWVVGAPAGYEELLGREGRGNGEGGSPDSEGQRPEVRRGEIAEVPRGATRIHVFSTVRSDLAEWLAALRLRMDPAGMLWVSWPKKASKVATDLTEDVVRELALPLGLVDVKVCAIDQVWSGLKLVIRRELR